MSESSILKSTWKPLLIIFVCIFVVYSQALFFDFVNYDDADLIYENSEYISNPSNILHSFTTHAFSTKKKESVYYRPVLITSYIIDYQIWKLNPLGYHLNNILLHCTTAMFVFLLIDLLLRNKLTALLASLLFALHPIQVESVAWAAGRNDILLCLFVVLMMYFYIQHHEKPTKRKIYLLLSILSYALALFTKESSAFYILLIPLYDLTIQKNGIKINLKNSTLLKYLPYLLILIIYLVIRINIFGEMIGAEKLYGRLSFLGRLKLSPLLLTEHLKLLLFPLRLSIEHPLDDLIWFDPPLLYLAWIIAFGFITALILTLLSNTKLKFGLLFLAIGLFPTLNIFPVAVPILEHRLYTPLVGFSIIVVSFLFSESTSQTSKIKLALIIFIIVLAGFGSLERLPVWKNSETLWIDAINKAPKARRPYFNLAGYYFDKREYDKTAVLLNKYIELNPDDFMGYSKLRQTYFIMGLTNEAAAICRKIIELEPKNQSRYIELAALYEYLNLPDSVISVYQEALRVDSTFYNIQNKLGKYYQEQNKFTEAETCFNRAMQLKPDSVDAYLNLGKLYTLEGKYPKALEIIEAAIKIDSTSQEISRLHQFLMTKLSEQH